jgi:Ca-activated chloride channel family protein
VFLKMKFLFFLLPMLAGAGLFDFQKVPQLYKSYSGKDFNSTKDILFSLKEESPIYYYNLGNVYYKLGRYQEAVRSYKRAFGEGVDEHSRLHNLANTYFKLKEYKKALSVYEIALKIRDDADTRYNLELTKKLLQKKRNTKKSTKKSKEKKKEKSIQKSKNKSDKKSQKEAKKLSKKELQKLNELEKKLQRKNQLKKMMSKSFKDRKVPVIMYPLNKKAENRVKPW